MTIRTLPHSLEAEEHLLSAALIDAKDVIKKCVSAHLSADSFYDPKHATVFRTILSLFERGVKDIDAGVLAEELRATKQLDAIGGFAFIAQVSGRVPTTAQAGFYIGRLVTLAKVRELIRSATTAVEDCHGFSGDVDELAATIHARIADVVKKHSSVKGKPLCKMNIPPKDDPSSLIGDRYICAGSGNIMVSTSGMGKSSMSLQAAICWAVAKALFGIKPSRPLKSVIFQSEDDEGDMAIVWESIKSEMNFDDEQMALIRKNVIVYTEKVRRGANFLLWMKGICDDEQPDLVWLNPLHAFFDGDIKDASEVGAFLREGLNKANPDGKWAYMIVHHTTKPAAPSDKKGERAWNEEMYEMAGSAELINWARAVIVIKPTKTEGQFVLSLAKRGKQAGVTQPTEDGRWETVTKIPVQHSKKHFKSDDDREFKTIFWELSAAAVEEESEKKKGRPPRPNIVSSSGLAIFLQAFPASDDKDEEYRGFNACHRAAQIGKSGFMKRRDEVIDAGLVVVSPEGDGYRRTKKGDEVVNEFLKTQK